MQRRAAMVQEEKNGDDPGGKYVLCHDKISDERPEVHGYRQLREKERKTKEDTNSRLKKFKKCGSRAVSFAGKNTKTQTRL